MKERDVAFIRTDFRILDSYKLVLDGLAAHLGDRCETVLHSLYNLDHSVIKIINGHYTSRHKGFPITNLALSMLAKVKERLDINCTTYFDRNQKGTPLKSATIVIRNHSRMATGLLCIDFYMNTSAFQFLQSMTSPAVQTPGFPVEEGYVENVGELIVQVVTETSRKVQNDSAISNASKDKEAVGILHQRGILNLKDAVVRVAGLMGISKNTAYMHVHNLSHS